LAASQVNSAKKEAEKYKNVKFIYTDAQGSSMKQVNDIEDLIAQGVDAILASPESKNHSLLLLQRLIKKVSRLSSLIEEWMEISIRPGLDLIMCRLPRPQRNIWANN
jgi:ABC-type xylose transport system substrate-binding protein